MFHKRYNRKKLHRRCIEVLTLIGEEVRRASDHTGSGLVAWGQFLDYEHSTEQTGTYGTAAAVKTLAIVGEPEDSEYLKGGLNWLRQSHDTPESRASKNNDWAVTYKVCYFLEAMEPNKQEIDENSSSADYFRTLMKRQLPNDGWGEYYFSHDNKDPKGSIIATALALYVLRRYVSFAGSNLGKEVALWFCKKIETSPEINSITIALAIIAIHDYSKRHNELNQPLTSLTKRLEQKITRFPKNTNMPEFSQHFTVNDRRTGQSRNRYIFLPVDAIVSYALITSGRYKRNGTYVDDVVSNYEGSILVNKAYSNQELAPRKSTVNHYWIALLMRAYSNLKPVGMAEALILKLKQNVILYWLSLISISIGIWIGVYFLIRYLDGNPLYSGIPPVVILIAGLIVNLLWRHAEKET